MECKCVTCQARRGERKPMKHNIYLRLDNQLFDWVKEEALRRGWGATAVIEEAIRQFKAKSSEVTSSEQ